MFCHLLDRCQPHHLLLVRLHARYLPLPTSSSYFDLAIFNSDKTCCAQIAGVIWGRPTPSGFSISREQLINIHPQLLNK